MLVSPEVLATGTAVTLIGYSGWQVVETLWESWNQSAEGRSRQAAHAQQVASNVELARLEGLLKSNPNTTAGWRPMVVAEIADESSDCRSFYLIDAFGQELPSFLPGQHLLVQLPADKHGRRPLRCYSLSDAPDPRYYRVTIKRIPVIDRELDRSQRGLSDYLHYGLRAGDSLLVRGPQGHFHIDPIFTGPIVLMAAGIGITPMISMLRWSLQNKPGREIHLFYQVRNSEQHPFAVLLQNWKSQRNELHLTTFYSRPESHEIKGIHFDEVGRFDIASLRNYLPMQSCKFYLCGPNEWMLHLEKQLLEHGKDPIDIAWESFGADATSSTSTIPPGDNADSENAISATVKFRASGKALVWNGEHKSLLEMAEANDIALDAGCRSGVCGACAVKKVCGRIAYAKKPTHPVHEDEILCCIARPLENIEVDA